MYHLIEHMFFIEIFHYFYYMMPGSKDLSPHELAKNILTQFLQYCILFVL